MAWLTASARLETSPAARLPDTRTSTQQLRTTVPDGAPKFNPTSPPTAFLRGRLPSVAAVLALMTPVTNTPAIVPPAPYAASPPAVIWLALVFVMFTSTRPSNSTRPLTVSKSPLSGRAWFMVRL